jgi:hypothetical protein
MLQEEELQCSPQESKSHRNSIFALVICCIIPKGLHYRNVNMKCLREGLHPLGISEIYLPYHLIFQLT